MPPQNKPDPDVKKLHLQARLHNKTSGGREAAAIESYNDIMANEPGWDDRKFITEACIALRMMRDKGWRPPEQSIEITAEILEAIRSMKQTAQTMNKTAQMFAGLDISSLKSQPGWNDEVWEETTSTLNENAADLLGTSRKWIDPDEEEGLEYYNDDDD